MDLEFLTLNRKRAVQRVEGMFAKAKADGRDDFNEEEEKAYNAEMKTLEGLEKQIQKARSDAEFNTLIEAQAPVGAVHRSTSGKKSIGQQVIDEKGDLGRWLIETKGRRSGTFESPSVEVKVLSESGSGLVLTEYVPAEAPPTPPTVVDLLSIGYADANAISFMRETGFTNAAAPVLEGGLKPESDLVLTNLTMPLRKVAHWLAVTEEMLEDVPSMRSYIDTRLMQGVQAKLANQVLNGDNVAPNMAGILTTPGLVPPLPQGTMTALDAILTQASAIYTASGLRADGVVLNPTDNLILQLAKSSTGEYLGLLTMLQAAGLRVAVSPSMAAGTALVGNFRTGGQLWTKGGLRVKVSNSHADFFIKNLLAIVAEIRAALTVYVPKAFGTVTGLTATTTP